MSGFLRADWIRFRHRRDVLVIALALPVLAVVGYASGLTSSGNQFSFDPDFSPPPEILAAMAAERQRFAFPQSVLTLLGSTGIGLLALVYLAVATVGDEFGWSTIRLSLLASSDRRRSQDRMALCRRRTEVLRAEKSLAPSAQVRRR